MAPERMMKLNLAVAMLALPALGPALAQTASTTPANQSVNPGSLVDTVQAAPPPRRGIDTFFGIRSSVLVSDNLALAGVGRVSATVLEVSPYFQLQANEERFRANINYQLRNFVRSEGNDQVSLARQALNGALTTALRGDWLWLDATGRIANVNTSAAGPLSFDPAVSNVNNTQIRAFSLSPYIRGSSGLADYEGRYTYSTTSLGSNSLIARNIHALSGSADTGARLGRYSLGVNGTTQRIERGNGNSITREFSSLRWAYRVNNELQVGATANYDHIEGLTGSNGRDYGVGPGGFFSWQPNTRTRLSGDAARRYYGNTGAINLSHRLRWLTFSTGYTQRVISSADADALFFNPGFGGGGGGGGTGALPGLGVPFNPVANNLLQQGLLGGGLTPFDLALITSTFVEDRRLNFSVGATGQHNSLVFTTFRSERESRGEFDGINFGGSGLLGGSLTTVQPGSFNGRVVQQGIDLVYRHRLDARSTVTATTRRTQIDSTGLVAGASQPFVTELTQFSLGYSARLTPDATASLLLRRTQQSRVASTGTGFTENAVIATLDVRL